MTTNPSQNLSAETTEFINKLYIEDNSLDFLLLERTCQLVESVSTPIQNSFIPSAITQGRIIANDLLVLRCDSATLAAGITYPAFYFKHLNLKTISEQLNPTIAKLILGVQRMEAIHHFDHKPKIPQETQIDNLRKMSLAMADDVRIILIKLAERLSVLKLLRDAPSVTQQEEAERIINIYAPLANRLGIGHLKWQLEDYAFYYLNPAAYNEISKALKLSRSDREAYINRIIHRLLGLLEEANIKDATINGRAKHIYSIYRKIQRKQVDFSQIYDISAIRILLPTIKDCYVTLGLVHSEWLPINHEFDDYIAKPKPNGYQSIHTVIVGPQNFNVEIQIRTYTMHEQAELGIAAHWKYKEGGTPTKTSYEQKINWLRTVIDWQKEVSGETNKENLFKQIFEDRIYVFTPKGDIFDLEKGATPLDFAYHVHTEIGHCCRGAKVNNILVPLNYPLNTGDQIVILTSKISHPSRDWLNPELKYLKTSRAINKVRNWFKQQNQEIYLSQGQDLWDKMCRREGIHKLALEKIYFDFNLKTKNDLLIAIGCGDININSVLNRLKMGNPSEKKSLKPLPKKISVGKSASSNHSSFTIEGMQDFLTQLARCCKPIPGDSIIGYITKGRGISIHQRGCKNMVYALSRFPEKMIEVNWINKNISVYLVELIIHAQSRNNLTQDISEILANEDIPLLGLTSRVNALTHITLINLTCQIKNLENLRKLILHLKQLPDVLKVERI